MSRFIRWLIYGDSHLHKWEIIGNIKMKNGDSSTDGHLLQCIHCGNLKTFQIVEVI